MQRLRERCVLRPAGPVFQWQPAVPHMILVGCGHSLSEACANAAEKC
jgi:hypothetical protein